MTTLREILSGGVAALLVVTGLRTWLQLSLATYVLQQLAALGPAPNRASYGLSLMQATVVIGVLVGGPLADHFGPRTLAVYTVIVLAPVLIVFGRSMTSSMGLLPLSMTFDRGGPPTIEAKRRSSRADRSC